MRWVRPARLPLLIAWLAIAGVLYWVGTNPHVVAPYTSNLVSRHLLRLEEGGLRVRDFRVRTFEGLDLYGVSLSLPDSSGGHTLISADTVTVTFKLKEALGAVPRLRQVVVRRPEVYSLAGHDSGAGETESGSGTGIALPRLVIDDLTVSDAFLEFSDSGGRLAERISRADWRGSLETGESIRAMMRGCYIDWETHDSVLDELRGEVTIDERGVFVEDFSGRLNGHPARVRGSRLWDKTLDIETWGEGVSTGEVANLIDQDLGFKAQGALDGTFKMIADTLYYEGIFTGDLEGYTMTDLRGAAVVTPTEVLLSDLGGNINGATFTGGGRFDIADAENVSFFLEGDAEDVDLSRGLVVGEEDLPVTDGRGRLRIEHTDNPMWTRVTGVLNSGFIEIMPFDTCLVDVEAVGDSLIFNRVELLYGDLHAILDGVSDTTQVFRGNVSLNTENLGTLPPDWEWPEIGGRLNGLGSLEGPLDDLTFVGWANVYDFDMGPLEAEEIEAALVIDDVLGVQDITAGMDGGGLSLQRVPFGDFHLFGSASPVAARVDSFRSIHGDTTVTLAFHGALSDSINRFLVSDFAVDLEGTRWSLEDPMPFTVGDGHFSVNSTRLASDQGAMTFSGLYEKDEVVGGSLVLENFDLALLNPFLRQEHQLAGRMTADVIVGGEPDAPQVNLTADLVDAPFPMADVYSLHVNAAFSQGVLDFEQLDLLTNYGRVLGEGTVAHPGAGPEDFWDGADLDLALTINNGEWLFLEQFAIPALDRLDGIFDGSLRVAGSTDEPVIRGNVTSAPFNVHWLHLDELTGEIWADKEGLSLGDLHGRKSDLTMTGRIEIPLELDLMSEPVSPLDGSFFMQLDIPWDSDLTPLTAATNAFVRCSGRGGAHLIVSGPLEHPLYQGTLEIKDAGFVLRNLEEIYHEVSAEGVFRGDELRVFNIDGREGLRGKFKGEGTVLFNGLMMETFDIRLDLDRFLVASIPDLRVVVSGTEGRMTGVKVGPDSLLVPKFAGSLRVDKARYTGSFNESGGGNDPLLATVAPDWLADLHLTAGPRVGVIDNREMNLYLGGDLDLIRDEGGMYLRGSLDVNAGSLIVFNNSFQVSRGRLDFSRQVGFDPRMDVDATTRYRLRSAYSSNSIIETLGVHVGGTMSQPNITFSSERGYSREAIQRMLLGLEPHASPQGDAGNLTASSIGAGFNLLEREIARELDIIDTFEIDQIQRTNQATGDSGLDPLIGVGKYIGSDLYLKYAQGVRQDDRDLIVEYQINRHLLLQSEIRRRIDENQGESTYNLDLKYRFEY